MLNVLSCLSVINYPFLQLFVGNINNSEVISNSSFAPFLARYVKFCPQRWNKEIALRVELYGCKAEGTFINLVTKALLKIKVLVSFKKMSKILTIPKSTYMNF